MKNINKKYVEGIKNNIIVYREYATLYNCAMQFAKGKSYASYGDIIENIEDHIEDTLNDIVDYLDCLYEDWSGLNSIKEEFRKTDNIFSPEYYAIEDEINEKNSKEGECEIICTLNNYSYTGGYYPANFIKELVQEYGCFTIDIHNNAWIM